MNKLTEQKEKELSEIPLHTNDKNIPLDAPVIPTKNSFILGDCMDYLKLFPPNYFDLAIVDPPYGIERFKRGSLRFDKTNKYKEGIKWDSKPAPEYFEQLFRVSKNAIIWGANNFTLPPTEYFLIWNKKQTVKNFASAEYAWTNCKQPALVFEYSIHQHNQCEKMHPTEKPILLYKWILRNYAKAGNLILDTHVGSASSLIACTELGFDYIGFEKDEEYYTMAKSRLRQATRKYELFEEVQDYIRPYQITGDLLLEAKKRQRYFKGE